MSQISFFFVILVLLNISVSNCQYRKTDTCSSLHLPNGRIRYKQRGKLAKFQCNTGYVLIGDRYLMCNKREWDGTPPVCARPGCKRAKSTANLVMAVLHHGASMKFFCVPGYSLHGPEATYCDGYRWIHNLPVCIKSGMEPDKFCDFENDDICGWTQDLNHEFDWRRHMLSTPSGHQGTGPSYDHTKGLAANGYYMYIESTSRIINDTARLVSPLYKKMENGLCFTFFYHMYGSHTGQLRIYIKKESDITHIKYTKPLFTMSGNQGNIWKKGTIQLDTMPENFQIIIEGVRGSSFTSDIAIDDVSLTETCPEDDFSTTTIDSTSLSTEYYESCLDRCDMNTYIDGTNSSCDCDNGCLDRNTCCLDYISVCLLGEVSDRTEITDDFFTSPSTTETDETTFSNIFTTETDKLKQLTNESTTTSNDIKNHSTSSNTNLFETTTKLNKIIIGDKNDTSNVKNQSEIISNKSGINKNDKKILKPSENDVWKSENFTETGKLVTTITTAKAVVATVKPVLTTIKPFLTSTPTKTTKPVVTTLKPPMTTVTITTRPLITTRKIETITTKKSNIPTTKKPVTTRTLTTIRKQYAVTTKKPTSKLQIPTTKLNKNSQKTTVPVNDFTEDETEKSPSVLTDYDETIEGIIPHPQTIIPKMQMLSHIEIQTQRHNINMILSIICSSIFAVLILISAFFVVHKYKLCSRIKFRHANNSDSLSDVRFLASDEIIDFNVRYAD